MNTAHAAIAHPPKRDIPTTLPCKRLAGWGMPVPHKGTERIQKIHRERRSNHALHSAFRAASWFCAREANPVTLGGEAGHALYFYNLPCGAKMAIWVPKLDDEDGDFAVYMSDTVSVQDLAKIQCDHVVTEITRGLAD